MKKQPIKPTTLKKIAVRRTGPIRLTTACSSYSTFVF